MKNCEMLCFLSIKNRSRRAETSMQKFKKKGKAAAEAAAFPVMEESKMETIILYHRKRKPPRITRGGPDHI